MAQTGSKKATGRAYKTMGYKGLTYRPERAKHDPIYKKMFIFLRHNDHLSFAKLIDMALTLYFASGSKSKADYQLFREVCEEYQPDFSCFENGRG